GPAASSARQPNSAGKRDRYLMNSPAISRAVSRRPPPSKGIMPSTGRRPSPACPAVLPGSASLCGPAGSPVPSDMVTGSPEVIVRATSASVLAGTSAAARIPGAAGAQLTSLTASRYRSVAASVIDSPSMSRHTPVSIGSVSSLLADGTTCAAAPASTPPSTIPAARGGSGSAGYSSAGSATSVNSALPQVRLTMSATDENSAGAWGRLRVISASSLPGTSTVPGSATSASTAMRAETSSSKQ